MRPAFDHKWDLTPRQAMDLQRDLATRVKETALDRPIRTVAGIDVSVRGDRVRTAVVVLNVSTHQVCEEATWEGLAAFPYVPGLLSFREIPAILPALSKLKSDPDLLVLDGQGRAHPRRFGLACHVGILYDKPSIGVAKSRLTGKFEAPDQEKGATSDLMDGNERIGLVVRTRAHVKPVYVSVGHGLDLMDALKWTLACTGKFKIPEPTRLAHHLSKKSGD